MIHYPIPPHQQQAYQEWANRSFPVTETIHQEVLSLPISPIIKSNDVEEVTSVIKSWKS